MAVRYIRDVLQEQIVLALKTAPASTVFGTRVYESSSLQQMEMLAPDAFPCLVVEMPRKTGTQNFTHTVCRETYDTEVMIYQAETELDQADSDMAQKLSLIRQSLLAYESDVWRRLGLCPGMASVLEDGWGQVGQDQTFRATIQVTVTFNPGAAFDDGS